jgi:hypothetical protein
MAFAVDVSARTKKPPYAVTRRRRENSNAEKPPKTQKRYVVGRENSLRRTAG